MTQSLVTARKLVAGFLDNWERFAQYDRDSINRLCRLAAAADPEVSADAARALFSDLIEVLNDSFDPRLARAYELVMAQVIDFFRREAGGKEIDDALMSFGLESESSLLARRARLRSSEVRVDFDSIRKVIFLSRVTIGADVAVTSVLMSRFRALAQQSNHVLIGDSSKLSEVFGDASRLRVRDLRYQRGGSVITRLSSWPALLAAVKDELQGLSPAQYAIVDPDSRLTQLGLLPLTPGDAGYFHFDSRDFGPRTGANLATLASEWFSAVFAKADETASKLGPWIGLSDRFVKFGRAIVSRLKRDDSEKVSVVSFGVGGNEEKRISNGFEQRLLEFLAARSKLIIDEGAGDFEGATVRAHAEVLAHSGRIVRRLSESDTRIDAVDGNTDVLIWSGGIGSFSGLIGAGDIYVGYDSAGQHIAAAQGVPVLTLFVNNASPRFAQRWRPAGAGLIEVLLANGLERQSINENDLLEEARAVLKPLLSPQIPAIT